MPSGFSKCEEGVEAYHKVGKEYDDTLDDVRYETILKKTVNSPHSKRNQKIVRVMVRELANDGNEYIKYDLQEILYDAIGGFEEVYRPNIGLFPIPVVQPKIDFGPDMTTRDIINGPIVRIDTGYLLPFTKENADKIHEMSNDISQTERTQYTIKRTGGKRWHCANYAMFRDMTFEDIELGMPPVNEIKRKKTNV
jgi:hypothetical protein